MTGQQFASLGERDRRLGARRYGRNRLGVILKRLVCKNIAQIEKAWIAMPMAQAGA